jgi:type I restriction enzyme S subunit
MTLPKGWVRTTVSDSCNARMGKTVLSNQLVPDGIPVYSAAADNKPWGFLPHSDVEFKRGTIVLSARGTIGAPKVPDQDRFVSTQTTIALHGGDAWQPEFLAAQLRLVDWPSLTATTTIPMLTIGALSNLALLLAPTSEQRRIVTKLDALIASISRARVELDRVPALAARLRASALTNAFAVEARQEPLSRLSEFVTSGSRGWAKYYSSAGAAFIRVGDVCRGNIRLALTGVQRVQPPSGAEGVRTALRPGDVVVTITADLGRVGVVTEELGPAFVNQHVALVRISNTGLSEWIAWYLTSAEGQRQMLAKDRGVTKAGLGLDDIRNVTIPIPASSERRARIKALEATFARADGLEAEAARARALLARLEFAILTKAFRGELVPQDPDDEPASVLLERVRAQRAAPKAKRGRRAREAVDA